MQDLITKHLGSGDSNCGEFNIVEQALMDVSVLMYRSRKMFSILLV